MSTFYLCKLWHSESRRLGVAAQRLIRDVTILGSIPIRRDELFSFPRSVGQKLDRTSRSAVLTSAIQHNIYNIPKNYSRNREVEYLNSRFYLSTTIRSKKIEEVKKILVFSLHYVCTCIVVVQLKQWKTYNFFLDSILFSI